ncbi:mitogen-activated protein kinase kinase kinase A-like [Canna indica]|uniref:Mitogen-activated protein kinase kinase kinase A-like n=1 Tax=Canna indica TaxID=4628 RepID=A0AAQ3K5H9_9LILI|nr:mitogen-activated protein kinase kinase kinase A-like [Canna indica]
MGIGGWRRGRVIGRGSSAAVSLATALDSGEVFAVKSAELSRSAILQREQRILSSLCSPYVISCLGFDVSSHAPNAGLCYDLFMEYAPGGSLSDEIARRGGRLDEVLIRSYACDVLRGLAYLHSQGVVHCDVKGRNVLIGSDGCAKIADLGCARLIDDEGDDEGERHWLVRGTPMFMAPEVARGEEQGPPADLWALGCTVIEMATGRPPWPDVSDPVGALHRVGFSPAAVPDFPNWLSEEGKDFLSKCLKRDPRQRWTAEQLLGHSFVASLPTNSPPKQDADRRWVSPKSTLDQGFWESLSDRDEEFAEPSSTYNPSARIQELLGGGDPNWSWDENWMTIRSNGEERAATADGIISDETAVSWASDHQIEAEADNLNFLRNSREVSVVNSHSDYYDTSNVRVLDERQEKQCVSCKAEDDSCNGGNVSVNSDGQSTQFKISYWLLTFVFTLLFLPNQSFSKSSVCLSTSIHRRRWHLNSQFLLFSVFS